MEGADIRLIAGLGNPGREYAGTRHNVGFMVLDLLAERSCAVFQLSREWKSEIVCGGDQILVKPMTYMNRSGESVGGIARFRKFSPEQCLIIVDDVALELGRIRIRRNGSAGGHNGLKSVIAHFGGENFPRMRIGVGQSNKDLVDHVLGKFSPDEEPVLRATVEKAADAVQHLNRLGIESAMNKFNKTENN